MCSVVAVYLVSNNKFCYLNSKFAVSILTLVAMHAHFNTVVCFCY